MNPEPSPLVHTASPLHLPDLRGRLRSQVSLAGRCWFRVGGPAQWLLTPADDMDLAYALNHLPPEIPRTMLGVGSNMLVRDGGIAGVVIRLGRGFASITPDGQCLHVGAGALDANVARVAADHGIAGLEFLIGIPGTIGGAVKMNAGAYGREIRDIVTAITLMDGKGNRHTLSPEEAGFHYRRSTLPEGWIITGATLQGKPDDPAAITSRMGAISAAREATQPVHQRTSGSTFTNPPGQKAWQLIDEAGCRGLRVGGAEVSTLHCNFLINHGQASAFALESLGETVRQRVHANSGIWLDWEIQRIGKATTSNHQQAVQQADL